MAYKTIKELLTAICDAVRSKTGTTGIINHQDIPAKINAIASSGSSSGSFGYIQLDCMVSANHMAEENT